MVQHVAQSEELAEAHDQRPPPRRIDPVGVPSHLDAGVNVDSHYSYLQPYQLASSIRIAVGQGMHRFQHGFQMNRTFRNSRWIDQLGRE